MPLSSSNLVPFGKFGGTREAGSTIGESQVALYRVGTHQIRRRRRAARSSTSQRSAEPLCARIKGANGRFLKEKLISDHGLFYSFEGQQGAANECGRVFPAGAEPGSPLKDAANWLPLRFSLSVETRRRYGWLRMVFPGACLFLLIAPIWCPSGSVAARETQGALSRRAWKEKLISDTSVLFLRGPTRSGERARFVGLFQGCTGLWTTGCWLERRLHQLKASSTMDLGISIFHISGRCAALRNLGLLIKTDWSVICPLCC